MGRGGFGCGSAGVGSVGERGGVRVRSVGTGQGWAWPGWEGQHCVDGAGAGGVSGQGGRSLEWGGCAGLVRGERGGAGSRVGGRGLSGVT